MKLESPTIKVLHLADLHWDPDYLVGSNAVCKELLCCRADSGDVVNKTDAAGYWGDYRSCDLPWYTIEKAVAHMAEKHSVCIKMLIFSYWNYYNLFL